MAQLHLHIGTSGWSYPDWKGIFYPAALRSTDWISHYSQTLNCTEINASFYRLPQKQTVINWVNKVPGDFKFCPKMSRYLTHIKKLKEPEEPLQRFFTIFDPMEEKMGPVLIQLPAELIFDYDVTKTFFETLRLYGNFRFALEVRHNSWLEKSALKLIAEYDIALVISQSGVGFPYIEFTTTHDIYLRFHGPDKLYGSSYTTSSLRSYAQKISKWLKDGHRVWAFFNNTMGGIGLKNALQLKALLAPHV